MLHNKKRKRPQLPRQNPHFVPLPHTKTSRSRRLGGARTACAFLQAQKSWPLRQKCGGRPYLLLVIVGKKQLYVAFLGIMC